MIIIRIIKIFISKIFYLLLSTLIVSRDIAFVTALTLNVLNIVDMVTTYVALKSGNFQELNPVILNLFKVSPLLMVLFKISIVLSVSILLVKLKALNLNNFLTKGIYHGLFVGAAISATVLGFISVHNLILLMSTFSI